MRVLSGQIPGRPERDDRLPLDELLPQVDALTLHCPLNEHTRHMLGARELALLKPSALVVNTARGGLIDEQALADALRQGHLGGAATDVLSVEPPVNGNPLLEPGIPRLIITPHSAWGAVESRQRIVGQAQRERPGLLRRAATPRGQLSPAPASATLRHFFQEASSMDPRSEVLLRQAELFQGPLLIAGAPADGLLAQLPQAKAWTWHAGDQAMLDSRFAGRSHFGVEPPEMAFDSAVLFLPKSREPGGLPAECPGIAPGRS